MLSYALAIIVAISSLVLFSTAFFMSKIHRRDDFLWSAVGLFYALVLWYCARNITGAVLLGQAAATALLVSSNWQIIKLRRIIANPASAAAAKNFSLLSRINGWFKRKQPQTELTPPTATKPPMPTVTEEEIAIPDTPAATPPTPGKADTKAIASPEDKKTKDRETKDTSPPVVVVSDSATDSQPEAKPVETPPTDAPPTVNQTDVTSKPSVDIEIIDKPIDQTSEESPQDETVAVEPLPTKLPEVATTTSTPPVDDSSADTEKLTEIIDNEPTATLPIKESEPPATPEPPEPAPSPLDSLETVEVAEVLDAADNRQADHADEIEVTTTDVEVIEAEQTIDDKSETSDK
ncbi:MAG: Ycf66 family protein [Cyanobacteria bacterium J06623_7]